MSELADDVRKHPRGAAGLARELQVNRNALLSVIAGTARDGTVLMVHRAMVVRMRREAQLAAVAAEAT